MSWKNLIFSALLGGCTAAVLPASLINGTFNIAGTITVTTTDITWTLDSAPFTADTARIAAGGTGDFAGLDGTTVTIQDLNNVAQPVGVSFPAVPFITFDAAPTFPTLDINFIFPGFYGPGQCISAPTAGQSCSLANSPFNFVNNPPPTSPQATATFVFTGMTSDGLETWRGNFTSQFTIPYQQVFAELQSTGHVTNTFSATFVVTPNSTNSPEAGTMSLLGLGLIALSVKLNRARARRS